MQDDKILENGSIVMYFDEYLYLNDVPLEERNFMWGVIKDSKWLKDQSMHGLPWSVRVYEVFCENGKTYHATHLYAGGPGSGFIETKEEHLEKYVNEMESNDEKIAAIERRNEILQCDYEKLRDTNLDGIKI